MSRMKAPLTLFDYCQTRGAAGRLATDLGPISPVVVSHWANGVRPIPEYRAPAIEWFTDFAVAVETMCPNTKWIRIKDPAWPNGKPLIDKAPDAPPQPGYTGTGTKGKLQPAGA